MAFEPVDREKELTCGRYRQIQAAHTGEGGRLDPDTINPEMIREQQGRCSNETTQNHLFQRRPALLPVRLRATDDDGGRVGAGRRVRRYGC